MAQAGLHALVGAATHSIFAALAVAAVFALIGSLLKKPRWGTLGIGLGVGMLLHIGLDLLLWFNGVQLLWPLGLWVNLWEGFSPAEWFSRLLDPAEFLFLALYFLWLARAARENQTDQDFLKALRWWTIALLALFVIFTPLAYLMEKGYMTIFGALYLVVATAAFVITVRMRRTVESFK